MTIRPYNIKDISALSALFFETVHAVNRRDYSEEQLFAWAPSRDCLLARAEEFAAQNCLVVEEDGRVVGFAGMNGGHLDMLYVHRDEQGNRHPSCDGGDAKSLLSRGMLALLGELSVFRKLAKVLSGIKCL